MSFLSRLFDRFARSLSPNLDLEPPSHGIFIPDPEDEETAETFDGVLADRLAPGAVTPALKALTKTGLPLPESGEFLPSQVGALIPLNDCGVVVRIEREDVSHSIAHASNGACFGLVRADGVAWMSRPLGRRCVGGASIEFCAGGTQTDDATQEKILQDYFAWHGFHLWDAKLSNLAVLPVKTPHFPDGATIVIDRLSAERLTSALKDIPSALNELEKELRAAEEALYAPLRRAFDAAWPEGAPAPDTVKMQAFFDLCRQKVKEGVLIPGWTVPQGEKARVERCTLGLGDNAKTPKMAAAGVKYAAHRLKP